MRTTSRISALSLAMLACSAAHADSGGDPMRQQAPAATQQRSSAAEKRSFTPSYAAPAKVIYVSHTTHRKLDQSGILEQDFATITFKNHGAATSKNDEFTMTKVQGPDWPCRAGTGHQTWVQEKSGYGRPHPGPYQPAPQNLPEIAGGETAEVEFKYVDTGDAKNGTPAVCVYKLSTKSGGVQGEQTIGLQFPSP